MNETMVDFNTSCEILDDFNRIDSLIDSKVFTNEKLDVFRRAAFTEILVCLRDLIAKSAAFSSKPCFKDDILVTAEWSK